MIEVIEPGLFTTVQDKGRFGCRRLGVPLAGALDAGSASMANMILGNDLNDALFEITFSGPVLEFSCDTWVSAAGAFMKLLINGDLASMNRPLQVHKGDFLSFEKIRQGARAYLAVAGGIKTVSILGSRSFFKGITPASSLQEGSLLPVEQTDFLSYELEHEWIPYGLIRSTLDVFKGPEFHFLGNKDKEKLLDLTFTVSGKNSRMGYRLNEKLSANTRSITTSPVLPGTVQYTPDGTLIILMRDCQTTGGYPRILQLSQESIDILAQKKAGDIVRFRVR